MIYQFSPPRCGSTLMWQILNKCYEGEVIKTHDWVYDNKSIVFCSIRDFRDSFLSYMRVSSVNLSKLNKDKIDTFANVYLKFIQGFDEALSVLDNYTLLKYEDFTNNYNIIFDAIEKKLNKSITQENRKVISEKFSFDSNMKIAKKFKFFHKDWDKKTKIHGKHLHKGEVGGWLNTIPKNLQGYYSSKFTKYIKKYGYKG